MKSSSSTTPAPTKQAPSPARSPGVRVIDEPPRASSWRGKPRGVTRPETSWPTWTPIAARRCSGSSASSGGSPVARRSVAVTGPYRFYDWDWTGRSLLRAYDVVVAPPTHALVHHALWGRRHPLRRQLRRAPARRSRGLAASIAPIEFHGEDTNLGRRLTPHRRRRSSRASAGSGRRRGAITRWGSGRCSACTSGTSGRRFCGTGRRTRSSGRLDVRI